MKKRDTKDILRAIPLGGHGEIGKNAWIMESNGEIIIINFGMMLPSLDLTGVDLIFPSTAYLSENESRIKGLILTSAHDDCSGGVSYLLDKVKIPKIWGSKLAIETIKSQLQNKTMPEYEYLEPRKTFNVGEFNILPIANTSVLPDTFGLYIKHVTGNILYTASYKIDQTPIDDKKFDYFSYAKAGEEGVDLLIGDSSNVESVGYSQSERLISKRFDEIFKDTSSRVVIVSYANNLYKFQTIFKSAQKNGRKIFLSGDYLKHKIHIAIDYGFIDFDSKLFANEKELESLKDNEIVILTTGKYGDFLTALISIAKQEHQHVKIKAKDIIVVSSNPPPGTARTLAHTVDQFFVQKVQVIGGRGQGVHVSGHAAQEESKFMLTISKPRSLAPSHGEERQLVQYGNIAQMIGVSSNDIHILKNGDVLELREQVARVSNKIPAQSIYYNQAKRLDIDETTMKERMALSEEGTITVALALDEKKNIIAGPEILAEACSFAKGKDWRAFCLGTVELVKDAVKQAVEREEKELLSLKSVVRDVVNKSVLELIGKRPLINISIQEIKSPVTSKQ